MAPERSWGIHKPTSGLAFGDDVQARLERIVRSPSESARHVERAKILLNYAAGKSVSAIARELRTNRPKVERCVDKGLQLGALAALGDLPRKGRPGTIPSEARAWVVSLACVKPKELGYPEELWTTRLLASHVRAHCEQAGHPSLAKLARGTVWKILAGHQLRPHKIEYYLEKRDPEFDTKMAQVLVLYKLVQLSRQRKDAPKGPLTVFVSYDEKPGIQAIGGVAPDPGAQAGQACLHGARLRVPAARDADADGRTGSDKRSPAPSCGGTAPESGVRGVLAAVGQGLSGGGTHPAGARTPFGGCLEGDAGVPDDDGESIRVRLHTQARLLAERGRIVLRQADQHAVARDAGGVQAGTAATHRTLHRPG